MRWVEATKNRHLYVVGTAEDADAAEQLVYFFEKGHPHSVTLNVEGFNRLFEDR
jgi:hypothetical protein